MKYKKMQFEILGDITSPYRIMRFDKLDLLVKEVKNIDNIYNLEKLYNIRDLLIEVDKYMNTFKYAKYEWDLYYKRLEYIKNKYYDEKTIPNKYKDIINENNIDLLTFIKLYNDWIKNKQAEYQTIQIYVLNNFCEDATIYEIERYMTICKYIYNKYRRISEFIFEIIKIFKMVDISFIECFISWFIVKGTRFGLNFVN